MRSTVILALHALFHLSFHSFILEGFFIIPAPEVFYLSIIPSEGWYPEGERSLIENVFKNV